MAVCTACDTELRTGARFCDSCGKPAGEASSQRPPAPAVEYKQVRLDWTGLPAIYWDIKREPPHPESSELQEATMAQRVLDQLAPLFADGWSLDGPYSAAVSPASVDRTSMFWGGNRRLYTGATVKLRRFR